MADAITQRLATMEASLGRTPAENRPTVATLHLEAAIVGIKQLPKDKSWGEEIKHWISMLEPMTERGWLSAADMSKIMDAMSAVLLPKKKSRWSMQDYTSILQFLTDDEWTKLSSIKDICYIQSILFGKARSLGCQRPSEPTLKLWACMAVVLAGEEQMVCSAANKESFDIILIQMRKKWNAYAKNVPIPPFTFQTLSSSNEMLKYDHRDIYDQLWPEGTPQPVVCKCNLMQIYSLTGRFDCKSGRPIATTAPAIAPGMAPGPHSRAPVDPMLADVITLMRQSQDTQQSQMRQLVAAVAASQGRLALTDSPSPSERMHRSHSAETIGSNESAYVPASLDTIPVLGSEPPTPARPTCDGLLGARDGRKADVTMKRPAGAMKRPAGIMKRHCVGLGQEVVAENLPDGWTSYVATVRGDKYFRSPGGEVFRSRKAVMEFVSKS